METRTERRKKERRQDRIRIYKYLILLSTIALLYFGIKIVNDNIVYLDYFKNPIIFKLNLGNKKIYLFGKSYFLDFNILKKTY